MFKIKGGLTFALGTNAAANDYLRSRWGHRDDLWFHLEGYRGPHLIAKKSTIGDIPPRVLQVIASALRDYGGLEITEIPVLFTPVKNLKGVKGASGKVRYSKEKYLKMIYDRDWISEIEKSP